MKPGYEIEAINSNTYIIKPTQFIYKPVNAEQLQIFINSINKAWENIDQGKEA